MLFGIIRDVEEELGSVLWGDVCAKSKYECHSLVAFYQS
jgi:hypothetical protein